MSKVKLLSKDDQAFEVAKHVAELSVTLKNMLEDIGDIDTPIPLPNVSGAILKKIIEYCQYYIDNPPAMVEGQKDEKRTDDITPWEQNYCQIDNIALFDLILAANYLDIKPLLDLTCKTVANMIKGKSPEEIRTTFNIKNDFTPEEEDAVRKENEWCQER